MINDLFSLREKEIFHSLGELKDYEFVVIGGYAVNAYALPRFSVDCNIVVKDKKEQKKIENVLFKKGYKKKRLNEKAQYSEDFCIYTKNLGNNFVVNIDILLGKVSDRNTGVSFSAEWIFKNSTVKKLKGKTIAEELKLRIININALIVMKTISCRATDIRDVFMMLPNAEDKEWIKSEVSIRYNLQNRISKIIEKVTSKQFKDGLSGVYGYFDSKVFEKHKRAIFSFSDI